MDDLISRAEAVRALASSNGDYLDAWERIEKIPAVDAAPVVHGRWMNIPDKPEWDQKMCSVCGDYFCCQGNYCPNCGAKMDGERRDDDGAN